MIVVDASTLTQALADDGRPGGLVRARLRRERLHAPSLVDLDVMSAIRRKLASGGMSEDRAVFALRAFARLRLHRTSHRPLLPRVWALRHNLTPYDAAYVALAEALDVPLVTADARLARAPGIRCEVELVSSGSGPAPA